MNHSRGETLTASLRRACQRDGTVAFDYNRQIRICNGQPWPDEVSCDNCHNASGICLCRPAGLILASSALADVSFSYHSEDCHCTKGHVDGEISYVRLRGVFIHELA